MSDKRRAATSSIIADLHYCFCSLTVLFLVQFLIRTITRSTARQRSCEKVMFLVMSVHHSVRGVAHLTITYDALDLTMQEEPPWFQPLLPRHGSSLYRNLNPTLLPHSLFIVTFVRLRFAFYWNAFLFLWWGVTSLKGQKYVGQSAGL